MTFDITNQADVFKFAVPLYDYLSQNGHAGEAQVLDQIVDSCFATDDQAVEAHLKAYRKIRETVKDLPAQYQQALDDALAVLSQE